MTCGSFTKKISLIMFTMKRLKYRIAVLRCISIENVILFRNLAELPNDIFLPYVLRKTIRDMHYRPLYVVFRVIAYYVAVVVFWFVLLEKLLTPYFLENRMHRLSFLFVVVEPLAEHIIIMLLNTHVGLALTVVFKQR